MDFCWHSASTLPVSRKACAVLQLTEFQSQHQIVVMFQSSSWRVDRAAYWTKWTCDPISVECTQLLQMRRHAVHESISRARLHVNYLCHQAVMGATRSCEPRRAFTWTLQIIRVVASSYLIAGSALCICYRLQSSHSAMHAAVKSLAYCNAHLFL